ncbi:MAG: hypothetical protein A3J55_02755 [Candidatus Ryanbacteria bacterium RIFCSPHIGHO2_02_FULL_45_17b]|nr:MAG: hypothetical protein A3J55_02755 [Candidatus Ryanbacteria bacterium RIFCSPHIGHO2_02_FULL_45_17b]
MKRLQMCYGIYFLFVLGTTGCVSRRAPVMIPVDMPIVQGEEPKPKIIAKSCQEIARDFNPERDIPNFTDTCSWTIESTRTPWFYEFHAPFLKRDISVEIGCLRRYKHQYTNVIGAEFYVFCRTEGRPDILGWGLNHDEMLGWVAIADGDVSWKALGWSPQLDIEANITEKNLQVSWLRFLFQYKQGLVLRLFSR